MDGSAMRTYKPHPTKKRPPPSMPKMPWDNDDEKSKAEVQQAEEPCDGDVEKQKADRQRNPETDCTNQDQRSR
jgi:hypothetical protein